MKRPLFTNFSFSWTLRRIIPMFLLVGSFSMLKLEAQTCATLNLAPNAYVCQINSPASYFINNFDIANGYSFQIISGSATIVQVLQTVQITWHTPGDVVFRMVETPPLLSCTPDTFRIRVGALSAPQVNCNDTVNLSLDEFCQGVVTPEMVIEGSGFNYADYNIVVRDPITKITIPGSPNVNSSYIGKFLEVSAIHRCSGNSCWGVLRVEDKLKPILACRSVIVNCGDGILPTSPGVGFPKPIGAPNPTAVVGKPNTFTSASSFYDNCGPTLFTYSDREVQVVCPPAVTYIDTVFRDWTATDSYGNQTKCTDTILIRAGSIANIVCPPSYDGIDPDLGGPLPKNPDPLQCNANFAKDGNGNPHPSVTGFPTGVNCRNINYTYTDIKLGVCVGSYKILREWFIADWCTGQDTTCIQLIKVVDDRGPILVCPSRDTVVTATHSCSGSYDLPLPRIIGTECSNPLSYDVLVKRGVPNVIPSSLEATRDGVTKRYAGTNLIGFHIEDLPVGLSWLFYIVTDACGNSTECATEIFVEEKSKPTPVCHQETVVALTDAGTANVFAVSFDDGSHDNCALDSFKVRRMNPSPCGGSGNTSFADYVDFCCQDIVNNPIIVILQVKDKAGNTNECMVLVTVQDKKPPVVTCLPNITVSCGYDVTDLNKFGYYRRNESDIKQIILNDPSNSAWVQPHLWGYDGLVIEDCNLKVDSSINYSINNCGTGAITRRYTFSDDFNSPYTCVQTITLNNFKPYNGASIKFPVDTTLEGCLSSVDSSVTGRPTWPANISCATILTTYEDEVFSLVENVCYKILRKWTVIDWCSYNPSTGAGRWTDVQVIKVKNTQKPFFTSSCNNRNYDAISGECNGFAELIATADDECTDDQDLVWSYKIDLGNNGSIDVNGASSDASGVYPVGTHKITWTVEDRCGNVATCTYLFTMVDRKQPTPVCRAGIITVIMPTTGQITIWASDLNANSFDNCTTAGRLRYSFSSNPSDASRTYFCADLDRGISKTFENVPVYVTDEAGNQDFCTTKVIIQDGLGNACPDNLGGGNTTAGLVSGTISTEQKSSLQEAMVSINGNMPSMPKYHMTQQDGQYAFASVPLSENYTIKAVKNDDALNGVTTNDIVIIQKHILGIAPLDNPYKLIAADVNESKSITARDIADLRKLILGITSELSIKKSWVFVESNYKFSDPTQPWSYSDVIKVDNLKSDISENNFVAVKLGDINGNAKANQLATVASRSYAEATLQVGETKFQNGEEIILPLNLNGLNMLTGLQVEFEFDPAKLELVDIKSGALTVESYNYNHDMISNGKIRMSFDQASGVSFEKELFSFVFKAVGSGELSNSFALSNENFSSQAYGAQNDEINLKLSFLDSKSEVKGFYLYQNKPNPFSTYTDISFLLPESGLAVLKICDVNGKVIKQISREFKSGLNNIQINNKDLNQTGIFYYILETENNRAVKKMILIN